MIAGLLQGTEESASLPLVVDGRKYKISRGVATIGAKHARRISQGGRINRKELLEYVPEGVESRVPYQGTVSEVINQLTGGLRSGMSYCGAKNLIELREKAKFIRITPLGMLENVPRVSV